MTYQQTIRDIHAALQAKDSTGEVRASVIELMRAEAERQANNAESTMVAQRHPLGFFACRWLLGEGDSLRLHLWSKEFNWAQEPGWEIHDHIFSFSSLLLLGSLRNRVYDIFQEPGRGEYAVYDVLYNGPESSMSLAQGGVGLKIIEDTIESTGSVYSMKAGILHSSELVSERAVSVLATMSNDTDPTAPRVVSTHRNRLVAFDRSPPQHSQVADLLAEYSQYLDGTR